MYPCNNTLLLVSILLKSAYFHFALIIIRIRGNTSVYILLNWEVVLMKILNSIKIKNVDFKNRIVMSPSIDGIMGDELLHHYLQRASSGMGLMICQSLSVTSKKMLDGGAAVYSDAHCLSKKISRSM
jgi:hypothetical protein